MNDTILQVGETISKKISLGYLSFPWEVCEQSLSPEEKLLRRSYSLIESHPSLGISISLSQIEELNGEVGYVIRHPLRVKECTSMNPKGSKPEDTFRYWRVQNTIQAIESIYRDIQLGTLDWEWRRDSNNTSVILKEVRLTQDGRTTISSNNKSELSIKPGKFLGAACDSNLVTSALINNREVKDEIKNRSVLTAEELILKRSDNITSGIGNIQVKFYGEFFTQRINWVKAEEAAHHISHASSVELKKRVYPPGLSVDDYFEDNQKLEIRNGEIFYRVGDRGVSLNSWTNRVGAGISVT